MFAIVDTSVTGTVRVKIVGDDSAEQRNAFRRISKNKFSLAVQLT